MWTFQMPGGIGDIVWCLRKLVNLGEDFAIELSNDLPLRGLPLVRMIPRCASARHGEFCATTNHPQGAYDALPPLPANGLGVVYTDCNTILHGRKGRPEPLANYLPKLVDTPYLEFWVPPAEVRRAEKILGVAAGGRASESALLGTLDHPQLGEVRMAEGRRTQKTRSDERLSERGIHSPAIGASLRNKFRAPDETTPPAPPAPPAPPTQPAYFGVYVSSTLNARNVSRFTAAHWAQVTAAVARETGGTPVFIGTHWDAEFTWEVVAAYREKAKGERLKAKNSGAETSFVPGIVVLQEELGTVLEIIKRLRYFIGFQSGLGALASTVRVPSMMFYVPHIAPIHEMWRPADQDAMFTSKALLDEKPEAVVKKLFEETVLLEAMK